MSKTIDENEIFIRTITSPKHHRKGNTEFLTKKGNLLYLPYLGGTSLNRYRYLSENRAKHLAKKMTGQEKYAGFALFSKNNFNETLSEYWERKGDKDFCATLKATPLNESNEIIENRNVYTNNKGNPSHADIIFNNNPEAEKPMPAIRMFSKILSQKSVIKIDPYPNNNIWNLEKFGVHFS